MDIEKIMKIIEGNVNNYFNKLDILKEMSEEDIEPEEEPTSEEPAQEKPKAPATPPKKEEESVSDNEPVEEEPVEEDPVDVDIDPEVANEPEPKPKGLNKVHKAKLRKWLLTNKKLNSASFQGLTDQMDIDDEEAHAYLFKIASTLLKQHLDKQK